MVSLQGCSAALRGATRRLMPASSVGVVTQLPRVVAQGSGPISVGSTRAASAVAETPEKKQSFDWIYNELNPVAYKQHILEEREYVCDNFTRQEFDRLLLPQMRQLAQASGDGLVKVTEIGTCFGNTTLSLLHGLTTDEIKDFWKDNISCEAVDTPRRFPSYVTGVDLSSNALDYCKRVGIADRTIDADLNSQAGLDRVLPSVREAGLLVSTASLVYLDVASVEQIVAAFAGGEGDGFMIVNFLNPFELEKSDAMKQILLQHLDFVGSTATRHRTLSNLEKGNYPAFGDWALLEIWALKRRGRSQALSAGASPEAHAPDDSENAFAFYKRVWGGRVGIYDDAVLRLRGGAERVQLASELALERLLQKAPLPRGGRVMDMGSAYGDCARYVAEKFDAFVSCVDLSPSLNAENRRLTARVGLQGLVHCPGERSFTDTTELDGSFNLVLSIDSFLQAGQHREAAIVEAARVLKPGGHLVFTDIMQSDTCDLAQMETFYKRIHMNDMGSPERYREWAERAGLVFVEFEDLSENLPKHFGAVRDVLLTKPKNGEPFGCMLDEFVEKMAEWLQSCVDQAHNHNLSWGYMVFKKPEAA